MDLNTTPNRQSLIDKFPKLSDDSNFTINSPQNPFYNCIAFAMGMDDRWVDNCIGIPGHWWPKGAPCFDDSDSLIKAFEVLGFEQCATDAPEVGFDKVALYKDNKNKWQHAAKILNTGIYHSKFGSSFDAIHSGGDTLESEYGNIYCFMRRDKTWKCDTITKISDDYRFQKITLPGLSISFPIYVLDGKFYDKDKNQVYLHRTEEGTITVSYNAQE